MRLGFSLDSWIALEMKGKDVVDFLQRTTSQNIKDLKGLTPGAFLTATGGVICTFWLTRFEDLFVFAVQKKSSDKMLQQIDKMHFGEDLQWEISKVFSALEILESEKSIVEIGPRNEIEKRRDFLLANNYSEWNLEQWQREKVLAFQPLDQQDLTEANIILEAGLFDFVHRNKGCYPGQEVIERIYTYGNIPRKFVQLEAPTKIFLGDIFIDEQKVGRTTTVASKGETFVANGYLLRAKAQLKQHVSVKSTGDGSLVAAKVVKISQDLNKDVVT